MKSLLFQTGASPHTVPPGCGLCDRNEVPVTIRKNGRLYRFILRDKISVDDVLLIMIKAAGFAIQNAEPYSGTPPDRSVRDFLIKQDVVI